MGDNVVPRQQGDTYQAYIFWEQAGRMFEPNPYVEKVCWESNSSGGFDDVVVHYNPQILDGGQPVFRDNFSIKFHVDYGRAFSCNSLIDPTFINSKKATILSRLHDAYKANPNIRESDRFIIINTWGIEKDDLLGDLIGNGGAIREAKLFDGTTDASKTGIVRKAWREHLKVTSDDELKKIIKPLRIYQHYHDLTRMEEQLRKTLIIANLKPLDPGKRTSGYVELIQRLHSEGQKEFTREELLEICSNEGFVIADTKLEEGKYLMGVRSFRKGAENLPARVHAHLCLLHKFSNRYLQEEHSWQQVHQEVKDFAERGLATGKPIELHLDTHLSLAYAMGTVLDHKCGAKVSVAQNTVSGKLIWAPDLQKLSGYVDPLWSLDVEELNASGTDLALAISVTHDIRNNVLEYVKTKMPQVKAIVQANILPRPSTTVIQNADHIIAAVQQLVARVREEKGKLFAPVKIHVFLAGPNAFSFFLGQQSKSFGNHTLYEFDFDGFRHGSYEPCISLPL